MWIELIFLVGFMVLVRIFGIVLRCVSVIFILIKVFESVFLVFVIV